MLVNSRLGFQCEVPVSAWQKVSPRQLSELSAILFKEPLLDLRKPAGGMAIRLFYRGGGVRQQEPLERSCSSMHIMLSSFKFFMGRQHPSPSVRNARHLQAPS